MTVAELIKKLQTFNPELTVQTNGCQMCVHRVIDAREVTIDGSEVWLEIED